MKEIFEINLGEVTLEGEFTFPSKPRGLIVFAQGSGSGRYNPRYNFIAQYLNKQGYITFHLDLHSNQDPELNSQEQELNIQIFANRLRDDAVKLRSLSRFSKLPFGFYGSNTGAEVAILAVSYLKNEIHAGVIKGGSTEMTKGVLNLIQTPTLLLVGENDPSIENLNRETWNLLDAPKKIKIIPNASHLFEETSALESVALEMETWFGIYLSKSVRAKKCRMN